jgi:putative sigma-54 modulation protein
LLFNITGKHIDITDALRVHAEEKASKLPKFYNNINQVEVVIGDNQHPKVDVEVIARGEHSKVFIVNESGDDAYQCIDIAFHKLERQLRRAKTKERNNKHISGTESA